MFKVLENIAGVYVFAYVLQVGYGASFIEFFAEEAKRVYGDIIPSALADRRLFVLKQVVYSVPIVIKLVTPFVFHSIYEIFLFMINQTLNFYSIKLFG